MNARKHLTPDADDYVLVASDEEFDAITFRLMVATLFNSRATLELSPHATKLVWRLLELGRAEIQRRQFAIEDSA